MFGLFKKRHTQPPPLPSGNKGFQPFIATKWVQSTLAYSVAGFSGAVLCGDGAKVIANAWRKEWAGNSPNKPPFEPDGLEVNAFQEANRLFAFILFPKPVYDGDVFFGVIVFGPCEDPKWSPESRKNLPYLYFVLRKQGSGTVIEEWTKESANPLGEGPPPEPPLFAEWVLNHTVRSAADVSVSVQKGDEAIAAGIARARSEFPSVLNRFLSGELQDAGFTVKVQIKDGENVEYFWLSELTFADGAFSGILDTEPQMVSNVRRGDRWSAPAEEVVDWMYARNQKMYGNYTLRALLPKMPPDQAEKYRAVLSEES